MTMIRGVSDVFRGASFLAARPRLWGWVMAPAFCAVIVLVALAWAVGALIDPFVVSVANLLPDTLAQAAASLLRIAVLILLSLGALSVYVAVVAMVAAPFNEALSESIEALVTGAPGEKFSVTRFFVDVIRGIVHASRRACVYLVKMAALFGLSFVPVVGPILYVAGGAWATAEFAAYDAYDAVWSRKRLRYRDKMQAMKHQRGRILGLGAVVALLLLLPVVNLLALSVGATAATLASLEASA